MSKFLKGGDACDYIKESFLHIEIVQGRKCKIGGCSNAKPD